MNVIKPELKDTYTRDEVYEILRQVIFTGEPEYYDQGGCNYVINLPPNYTKVKAMAAFEKYYLKQVHQLHES